jgi:hypothetical protein
MKLHRETGPHPFHQDVTHMNRPPLTGSKSDLVRRLRLETMKKSLSMIVKIFLKILNKNYSNLFYGL